MTERRNLPPAKAAVDDPYTGLPAAEILREIAEIFATRMVLLLPVALQRAAASLNRQATETLDLDKRLLSLEAARLAQYRLAQLPADFRRYFDRLHPRACRYDPLHRFDLLQGIEPDQLQVMDDAAAQEALDARDLIQALQGAASSPCTRSCSTIADCCKRATYPRRACPSAPAWSPKPCC